MLRFLEVDFTDAPRLTDIAGVPGTGKTATVHAAIKQLRQRAEEGVSRSVITKQHSMLTSHIHAGRPPLLLRRNQRSQSPHSATRLHCPLGSDIRAKGLELEGGVEGTGGAFQREGEANRGRRAEGTYLVS